MARKSSGPLNVTVSATLSKGMSVLGVMGMLGSFDSELVTVDIEARLKYGAIRRRFREEGIPLDNLMTKVGNTVRKQAL